MVKQYDPPLRDIERAAEAYALEKSAWVIRTDGNTDYAQRYQPVGLARYYTPETIPNVVPFKEFTAPKGFAELHIHEICIEAALRAAFSQPEVVDANHD